MTIYEYGSENAPKFLFIATAACEPFWAFRDSIALLKEQYHVYAVAADGHDPEHPSDFVSIEKTVDDMMAELKRRGATELYGAYGLSMGGAIITRFLAVSGIPVKKAIIDAGIMPYTYPKWICKLILARDVAGARLMTRNRKILEMAFPPEKYTAEGWDPKESYDGLMEFYKTYSSKTIKNVFWSTNNYELPHPAPEIPTKIEYWYGSKEKKARKTDMAYIREYLPGVNFREMVGYEHGEFLMVYPKKWFQELMRFMANY